MSAAPDAAVSARTCAAVAGLAALAFACVGYAALAGGHPQEDAYILFKYARNLAAGDGFAFNPGGPPVEGATDFLWLLLVAGGVRLGGDVALVALAWNAIGAFIAVYLLARVASRAPRTPVGVRAIAMALAASAVVSNASVAALGGFSTVLFGAGFVALYAALLDERRGALLAIPALALAAGLLRPDGVVPGAACAVLGLVRARREGHLRPYLAVCGAAVAVGAAYFVWRYCHFGLLLPLPLYVKGADCDVGAGLATCVPGVFGRHGISAWVIDWQGPALAILAVLGLALFGVDRRARASRWILLGLIPGGAMLATLALGHHLQNFAYRFEAPVYLLLLFAIIALGVRAMHRMTSSRARFGLAMVLVLAVVPASFRGVRRMTDLVQNKAGTYMDTFAPALGAILDDHDVVVLTEAGRIPYWSGARFVDAVGLNTPQTARGGATLPYLRERAPAMVMFHHSFTLSVPALFGGPPDAPIVAVDAARIRRALLSPFDAVYRAGVPAAARIDAEDRAALQLLRFLDEASGYDLFVVDYTRRGDYEHIYAFRRGWAKTDAVLAVLRACVAAPTARAYTELRRGPP